MFSLRGWKRKQSEDDVFPKAEARNVVFEKRKHK